MTRCAGINLRLTFHGLPRNFKSLKNFVQVCIYGIVQVKCKTMHLCSMYYKTCSMLLSIMLGTYHCTALIPLLVFMLLYSWKFNLTKLPPDSVLKILI